MVGVVCERCGCGGVLPDGLEMGGCKRFFIAVEFEQVLLGQRGERGEMWV